METAWNNVKVAWEDLIRMLPTLLTKNGEYVYFGQEPDCTPYSICRATLGWRDCWVIAENGEDSPAFVMEVSRTTEGYFDDIKEFIQTNWCWDWDEDIWVLENVRGQKREYTPAELLDKFNREIPNGDSLELVHYIIAHLK